MSANYQEIQLLSNAVLNATGQGAAVTGQAIARPYGNSNGYTSAIFQLECSAVTAAGVVDVKVQGKLNNGSNWFDLIDQFGKAVAFDTVQAVGQQALAYNGPVPANLRAVYTLVSGTSVTVNLNVALAG